MKQTEIQDKHIQADKYFLSFEDRPRAAFTSSSLKPPVLSAHSKSLLDNNIYAQTVKNEN